MMNSHCLSPTGSSIPMDNDRTTDELNHLIEINKNAEMALNTAAENVKNSELESLFSSFAKQHAKFATELEAEVHRLGGNASHSGTLGGLVHRGWMDLKSAVSG